MNRGTRAPKLAKPGGFEVPLADLRDRLALLAPANEPDAVGLWIDEPWAKLPTKDLHASPSKVAAAACTLAMWPFLAKKAVEDSDAWEIIDELVDNRTELPKGSALRKPPAARANERKGKTFVFAGRVTDRYVTKQDLVRTVELNGGTVAVQAKSGKCVECSSHGQAPGDGRGVMVCRRDVSRVPALHHPRR